jgi:hypothetical protein
MLEVLDMQTDNRLGFKVDGRIEKSDVQNIYKVLEEKASGDKKVQFYAEIDSFGMDDFSSEALREDLRLGIKNLAIIPNIEKCALVTDSNWIKRLFEVECALIPTLTGKAFTPDEKDLAIEWLETDQREPNRLDITFSEMVETSALKFAGGFALGMLTAGLFSKPQRKTIGTALLLGTIAGGIPLGVKVLNNNRRLLREPEVN